MSRAVRFAVGRLLVGGTANGDVSKSDAPGAAEPDHPARDALQGRLDPASRGDHGPQRGRAVARSLSARAGRGDRAARERRGLLSRSGRDCSVERRDGAMRSAASRHCYEMPQGLVLEVSTPRGTVMLPYRPEVVATVDLCGAVVVEVPEGSMDDVGTPDRDSEGSDAEDVGLSIVLRDYRRHDLSRLISGAAVAQHSGAARGGGRGELSRRRPAGLHARPASDGGRLAVWRWGRGW